MRLGNRTTGFTLIEVVAATAVLAMVLATAAMMAGAAARLSASNARKIAAAGLLGLELERVQGMPFGNLADRARAPSELDARFELEVSVRDAGTGAVPVDGTLLKEVDVVVYWPGLAGSEASLAGTTLVARRDMP